jgi:ribosomal protein S18 acetylase RimI-like enzyme
VIGYLVCCIKSLVLHIANLAVDCGWRRRGVARRLVQVILLPIVTHTLDEAVSMGPCAT